jgi:hypothetical protein
MKKTMCLALVALLGVSLVTTGFGQEFNKAGRSVFQFLKIGVGARQSAIGEASIASVEDVNSLYWNPSGIAGIQSVEGSFSYNRWFVGMNYFTGAAGARLGDIGVVALGFSTLSYGSIDEALAVGSGGADTRTGSTFTGSDMMASLAFAHQFNENLSIGVSVKYIHEKLWIYSQKLLAFDVGTNYNTGFKGIKFAMSFQNFGSTVKFLDVSDRDEGYDLPLIYRIGFSTNLFDSKDGFFNLGDAHQFVLSFEAVNTNDFGERYNVGGEYAFGGFLFLRGGYRFLYDEGNLSLGAGIRQKVSDLMLNLDFSYVSYQFLESPYRLTLTVGF